MDDEPTAKPPADASQPMGRRKILGGLAALGAGTLVAYRMLRKRSTLPPPVREALLYATTFDIVAIHPAYSDPPCQAPGEKDCSSDDAKVLWLHRILGRARVDAREQRTELVDLIDQAIDDGHPDTAPGCFDPRHAVSAIRDGRRIDILICFECLSLVIHDEPESTPNAGSRREVSRGTSFPIGQSVRPRMNEIYRDHGLVLAPTVAELIAASRQP